MAVSESTTQQANPGRRSMTEMRLAPDWRPEMYDHQGYRVANPETSPAGSAGDGRGRRGIYWQY
jgi:hypothetical protein